METFVSADCAVRSIAEDTGVDRESFETADAAIRSANFDVRSKLFSFNIPCSDESICTQTTSALRSKQ